MAMFFEELSSWGRLFCSSQCGIASLDATGPSVPMSPLICPAIHTPAPIPVAAPTLRPQAQRAPDVPIHSKPFFLRQRIRQSHHSVTRNQGKYQLRATIKSFFLIVFSRFCFYYQFLSYAGWHAR
jgi:hypothetical protein